MLYISSGGVSPHPKPKFDQRFGVGVLISETLILVSLGFEPWRTLRALFPVIWNYATAMFQHTRHERVKARKFHFYNLQPHPKEYDIHVSITRL